MKQLAPQDLVSSIESNPLIDVRTPAEFASGHIPGAINIPLFSNEERAEVGTLYKQVSRDAAMIRALEIVGPKMSGFVKQASTLKYSKHLVVHCWRGGMRSSSFTWLLNTAGIPAVMVEGGYKAVRRYNADVLNREWNFKVITACTGSGKTELLCKLKELGEQVLDLEAIASHKGSVFGGLGHAPQPTSEQFENDLFWEIKDFDVERAVWVEDESMCIGHVFLPQTFYTRMHFSPLVKVGIPLEARVDRLVNEYAAFNKEHLAHAIGKISKRLGGDNAKAALEELDKGNFAEVTRILLRYYDKAYLKSIEERRNLLVFEREYSSFDALAISSDIVKC